MWAVLDSEDAALLAPEFGCNVVIDEGAAFDITAPCVFLPSFSLHPADLICCADRSLLISQLYHIDRR
jgi:hypothetical protein